MKKRKNVGFPFCAARAYLTMAVVVLTLGLAVSAAAQTTSPPSDPGQTSLGVNAGDSYLKFVPAGYSVEGPLQVYSATQEKITFATVWEKKPLVLDLKGKRLTVKDSENKTLTIKALTKGVRVIVCRNKKQDDIIIFLLKSQGKERGNDL